MFTFEKNADRLALPTAQFDVVRGWRDEIISIRLMIATREGFECNCELWKSRIIVRYVVGAKIAGAMGDRLQLSNGLCNVRVTV